MLVFGSSLHMHHFGISLGLGQASKTLVASLGPFHTTCSSDVYWFRHRIRGSISPTLCSQWLPPYSLASGSSSSLFFWSVPVFFFMGFSQRLSIAPFPHAVLNTRGCPQVPSSKRKRTGICSTLSGQRDGLPLGVFGTCVARKPGWS